MRSRCVLVLAAALAIGCATAPAPSPVPPPPPPPGAPVAIASFEPGLAPYGEWIFVAPYGRVWHPAGVGVGWHPYFYGEWIWTDEGWFWQSDEPWGWATYHYGRWVLEPTLGWAWIPGMEWAPAWVAWRVADGYVGWAPLPPGADVWWTDAFAPDPIFWVFVPSPRFVGTRVNTVALAPAQVRPIVVRARPAPPPGHGVVRAPPRGGPPRPDVERQVGRAVPPARIVPVPTPDAARAHQGRDTVPAYRPAPPPAHPAPAPAPAARPAPAPAARDGKGKPERD